MAVKDLILGFSEYDVDHPIAGLEEIRKINPQRYEMEQLTAIVYDCPERNVCVGYKDVTPDEFWVRGHMPELPLMPGVLMCEAAAQLCSYHTQKHNLLDAPMVGFGGLENVRFRDVVVPGDRFVIVAKKVRCRPRSMISCRFQGFVGESLVVEGQLKGIPMPVDAIAERN